MSELLGDQLRREQRRRKMSQRDAVEHFGVVQSTYHRWETGEYKIKDAERVAVADFLGASLADVLEYIVGQTPTTQTETDAKISALRRDVDYLLDNPLRTCSRRIDHISWEDMGCVR